MYSSVLYEPSELFQPLKDEEKSVLSYKKNEKTRKFAPLGWKTYTTCTIPNNAPLRRRRSLKSEKVVFMINLAFVIAFGMICMESCCTIYEYSGNTLQKERRMEEGYTVPVLLDYTMGNFRFSSVLSKCLNLKHAPVDSYIEMIQVNTHHFITWNIYS